MTNRLSASEIARAAGVGRAAVSNWRERNPDFPAAPDGSFSALEVAAWLDKRRVPRDKRQADEPEGTTYGDRFRRALGLAGTLPSRLAPPKADPAAEVRKFAISGLHELRGAAARANYQELMLGLLQARAGEQWKVIRAELQRPMGSERMRRTLAQLEKLGLRFVEEIDPSRAMQIVESLDLIKDAENSTTTLLDDLLEDFAEFQMTSEFHTPRSIVRTVTELLQPTGGETIYDPCCGNGSFLAAAADRPGARGKITGRALAPFSWQIARMRLAMRDIDADLGDGPCNVLQHDVDRDRKFDVIMTNPPFAMRDWAEQLTDPRWRYGTPQRNRANFAWIQHVIDKLAPAGRAAVVMAPAATFAGGVEADIRRQLIDAQTVEAVIELPRGLFRSTGIPVDLWLLRAPSQSDDRVLFVSAKDRGRATSRVLRELTDAEIDEITAVHRQHRLGEAVLEPGFARTVHLSEISRQDYQLQPAIYLSSPQARFHSTEFATDVTGQHQQLSELTHRSAVLKNLVSRQLDRVDLASLATRNSRPAPPTVLLSEVCDVLAGPSGMLREIPADAAGIPVLTPRSLRRNRLVQEDLERVDPIARERLARYLLKTGDILCSRTGTIGRTALVTGEHRDSLFGPGFLRLRPNGPELSNHYLLHYLAAEWAQDWMDEHCSRTTIPSLSAKTMRQLPIWLPPLDQQEAITEIMSSLDEQLALQDEIADTAERLKYRLGQLIGAGDFPLND
ncbi:type I restriction-modification system subunit M/S [Saccharopolyspora elongata]|uniref:Uncharacterized protein n=1 Tax=Saccharopolyspora elongata TaxID=2530387 RepID=A0A4R4ZH62_9PSEU|nr:type I restriction-modification system subunit M/S [Saccharopolyspora elongata]TDD56779.1 hypothetical protein E1288_01570 [Saccharopolyspora elongata]